MVWSLLMAQYVAWLAVVAAGGDPAAVVVAGGEGALGVGEGALGVGEGTLGAGDGLGAAGPRATDELKDRTTLSSRLSTSQLRHLSLLTS